MKPLTISIGIPVYNEEKNIEKLLRALLQQKTSTCHIQEIYVIASGCTDETVSKSQKIAKNHSIIRVIEQKQREGKASAINTFLKKTHGDVIVIASGDILPEENTIEELCKPLQKDQVGMTGGHPVPTNPTRGFINNCVHTLWELHHEMAKIQPKCGEIIAFKNTVSSIPKESPVDEASIEKVIKDQGLSLAYAPKAIVYNRGPSKLKDLFQQRRRINAGHLWLKKHGGYTVGTNNIQALVKVIIKRIFQSPFKLLTLTGLMLIEIASRVAAHKDFKSSKSYTVWEPLPSTKKLP